MSDKTSRREHLIIIKSVGENYLFFARLVWDTGICAPQVADLFASSLRDLLLT